MTMQTVGVGAVIGGGYYSGLGRIAGLGISGPFGDNPKGEDVTAGPFEISGTQVMLRDAPGGNVVSGAAEGFNGKYGSNNDLVVPPPDQVDFDGKTLTAQGLTWASVTAKTGNLAGKKGFVAVKFLAPIGWTASHNGTGPVQGGGGGGGGDAVVEPPLAMMAAKKTNYVPWIIGGVVLAGLVVGGAVMGKKGYRRAKAHVRLRRIKRRRRA